MHWPVIYVVIIWGLHLMITKVVFHFCTDIGFLMDIETINNKVISFLNQLIDHAW